MIRRCWMRGDAVQIALMAGWTRMKFWRSSPVARLRMISTSISMGRPRMGGMGATGSEPWGAASGGSGAGRGSAMAGRDPAMAGRDSIVDRRGEIMGRYIKQQCCRGEEDEG